MDVWVMTGEAEFSDGGIVRTFDTYGAVFSTADLGWAEMHRGYGYAEGTHKRLETEDTVWCRECVSELRRITVDASPY